MILRFRQITQTSVLIIHDIIRKPSSIIVLLYIFHIIHTRKQKRSVQPFCFCGEHSKGLSNQAAIELDMINTISVADVRSEVHLSFVLEYLYTTISFCWLLMANKFLSLETTRY